MHMCGFPDGPLIPIMQDDERNKGTGTKFTVSCRSLNGHLRELLFEIRTQRFTCLFVLFVSFCSVLCPGDYSLKDRASSHSVKSASRPEPGLHVFESGLSRSVWTAAAERSVDAPFGVANAIEIIGRCDRSKSAVDASLCRRTPKMNRARMRPVKASLQIFY